MIKKEQMKIKYICLELNLCLFYGLLDYDSSFQLLKVLKHIHSQSTDEAADAVSGVNELGNTPLNCL